MKTEGGVMTPSASSRNPLVSVSAIVLLIAIATTLQGCETPHFEGFVPSPNLMFSMHKVPFWRMKPDYWVVAGYKEAATGEVGFNSCMNPRLSVLDVCNRQGSCIAFDPTDIYNPILFCKCNPEYGGTECQFRRKKQSTTFFLALLGGWAGVDQFYLGNYIDMVLKILVTCAGAVLLLGHPNKVIGLTVICSHWLFGIVASGASPAQGKEYRTTDDLPRWAFVVMALVHSSFIALIFGMFALRRKIQLKRLNWDNVRNYSSAKIIQ
eukprot:TRINITY_DN2508_c1_g1_i1.p1 TRINITY_DN2508_c1_g1~~TRINITY_DN2508_c1_g1_i1.p1  ORF type:complete len:266 (+),score=29.02 TRINITY_DN2508_c1_g1_i1:112-909(+)